MPYKYIGRTTYYKGKTIWEIVGNLKNFGIGRILVRSRFEHYPELSFIRIKKVEPHDNPENPSMDNIRRVSVLAEKVFRGRRCPDTLIKTASYKADYRLIPKDEEEKYLNLIEEKKQEEKIFPRMMPLPPLMRELMMREAKASGKELKEEPQMEVQYKLGTNNRIRIAKEGETPNVELVYGLGTPASPSLYKGINLKKRA